MKDCRRFLTAVVVKEVVDCIEKRQIRFGARKSLRAPSERDTVRLRSGKAAQERFDERRLSDAWLARDADERCTTGFRCVESFGERLELLFAADDTSLRRDRRARVTACRLESYDAVENLIDFESGRALFRILHQHAHDQAVEHRGNARVDSRRRNRVPQNDRAQDSHVGARVERMPPGRKLVEHYAE